VLRICFSPPPGPEVATSRVLASDDLAQLSSYSSRTRGPLHGSTRPQAKVFLVLARCFIFIVLSGSLCVANASVTDALHVSQGSLGIQSSEASAHSGQFTPTIAAAGRVAQDSIHPSETSATSSIPKLTISPTSVAFGDVRLRTSSTRTVKLTSTGTAPVTIRSGSLTGTGFSASGATTAPLTLNPGQSVTIEVHFDPSAVGPVSGQGVIYSNSSTNATQVISLSGTGESASHHVDLSWGSPTDSSVSIKGYDIYRSTGGSSAYQLLNSSVDTETTYVDSTVQSGLTYDYIVKSVDSAGVESGPSNEVTATVP
jgi:Abnormal spindle-like microcephaly-assoc'd, ASPM-SPD-2-Hydin